jgi:excisionase family DNA binding protein
MSEEVNQTAGPAIEAAIKQHESTTLAAPAGVNTEDQSSGILTTREVLKRLRISRRTLHTHVLQGAIPAIKLGRRTLFHWPTIEAALLRRQRGGQQ